MEIVKVKDVVTEYRSYEWNGYTPLGMIIKKQNESGTFETNAYQFITNHRGDVLSIRDKDDKEVGAYTYDAYGNVLTATGDLAEANPIRYAGYYYDKETKNYYLQARYYNPANGAFLALDPHPGDEEDPLSQNGYSYANGNPVMKVDPNGEFAQFFVVGIYYIYVGYKVRKYVKTVNGIKKYKNVTKKKRVKKTKTARLTVKNVANAVYHAKRVGTAATKKDSYHRAAELLTQNQLNKGVVSKFRGGDGRANVLLEVKGIMNGKSGIFEYILDSNGNVSHQMFVQRNYYLRGNF